MKFKLTKINKEKIIELYKEGYSRSSISRILGINESTYRMFISKYKEHGDILFNYNKPTKYSNEFKQEIIDQYNLGYSKKSIVIKYNLRGDSAIIRQWLANESKIRYNVHMNTEMEIANMNKNKCIISNTTTKEQEYLLKLEKALKENEMLKIENEYLKKLDVLVETRIKQQQKKK